MFICIRHFHQNVAMTSKGGAPAPENFSFERWQIFKQRGLVEYVITIFDNDLFPIAIAAYCKWISPLGGTSDVNVVSVFFAVDYVVIHFF